MTTQTTPDAATPQHTPEFHIGQLVEVDWERLGEITEILTGGYYRVWIEGDDRLGSGFHTVHQQRIDALTGGRA